MNDILPNTGCDSDKGREQASDDDSQLSRYLLILKKETEHKIRMINSAEKDPLKRAYSIALALAESNAQLKARIMDYEFNNEDEEIYFFKFVKPYLVSRLIYYCQLYNIEMNRPVGPAQVQREYLYRELRNLQDYIERRPEFYSYYRLGSTQYDVYYFTRDRFEIGRQYLEATMSEREPRYSTNCDYKLAKIQANERLEIMIKMQLDELDHPHEEIVQLPWETKKVFLIELLYALDSFRAFGKMPLKKVVHVFQKLCVVDLGNVSSAFAEMKERNDPTPFLDSLKEVLLHRMKRDK
ncbi:MAG: RteC domain-containing protein [Rikenellaceae bacterium]|nr:RteC domain-containing protein [Rikenellaceae bacterium]